MKKSLKDRVTSNEFFRLPQMNTENTFQEMQQRVTQKYAQVQIGPFPESENQKPYDSDDDYQGVEDAFGPWESPPYPKFEPPQIKVSDPSCWALWLKIFPGWTTGTRYLTDEIAAGLKRYIAAGCPVDTILHYCCKKGQQIVGPSTVESGGKAEFSYPPADSKCDYDWSADKGWIVGGSYEAPYAATEMYDVIRVSPFIASGDRDKICASKKIKIQPAGCGTATLSPTTLQMAVNTTQTLNISNPVTGVTYSWSIVSGGGSFSNETSTSIDYTAPATNENCDENPTIELRRGTALCGTLKIAINGGEGYAVHYGVDTLSETPPLTICTGAIYNCDGTVGLEINFSTCEFDLCIDCIGCASGSYCDVRDEGQKAAGCCPIQLL